MTDSYHAETTGLILVDLFNDFLSEGGQNWESVKEVALEVGVVENLKRLVHGARAKQVRLFYAMHRQAEAEEFAGWKAISGTHEAMRDGLFEKGSWGAEIHSDLKPEAGDVMALEHWTSSGFANTDLDFLLQHLRRSDGPLRAGAWLSRHLSFRCRGDIFERGAICRGCPQLSPCRARRHDRG